MKNIFSIFALIALMTFGGLTATFAQKMPELDKSPLDMAYYPARAAFRAFEKDDEKKASLAPIARVIYSRPQLNGRSLTDLVPVGEPYRLGANEATELGVMSTIKIGDATIEPGRYTLYTYSESEGDATLIVSKDLDGWGAYAYNKENDVARIEGKLTQADESVEALTIMFTEDSLVIAWSTTRVEFPVAAAGE
jgi:hypothetical protein